MSRIYFVFTVIIMTTMNSCVIVGEQYTGLPPGIWRAKLQLIPQPPQKDFNDLTPKDIREKKLHAIEKGVLPFNFEVVYDSDSVFHLEIINGEERIIADDIQMGWSKKLGKDTILIQFPIFETYIRGVYLENIIQGEWVVTNKENYSIPFSAKFGEPYRFTNIPIKEAKDFEGKWMTTFDVDSEEPYQAIGTFKQTKDNKLTGTFETETGDYRYLEGTVIKEKMYLSTFDGSHAFLFEGTMTDDGKITGSFRSGTHYFSRWIAERNDTFQLRDPNSLTQVTEPYKEHIDFSFPDTDGKLVSLSDPEYHGKVKIVTIFGTWCPNCKDETAFLREYVTTHPDKDLAVIALAFEKHSDSLRVNKLLKNYKEKMEVPYPILWAGKPGKDALTALPMLDKIMSYPTMLFIDKNNKIQKIHTGFSGPATPSYPDFINDFEDTIEKLLEQ